jgi:hypothetical protein
LLLVGLLGFNGSTPQVSADGEKSAPTPTIKAVDRVIVGGYAENITYVSGGRFNGLIAMAVGAGALGAAPGGGKHDPVSLFNFYAAGQRFRPTGLVYVKEWDRFVANDSDAMARGWPEQFLVFDDKGAVERRPVIRGAGIAPTAYSEGLAYVPSDAADWPADLRGRILMVGFTTQNGVFPRVDVIEAGAGDFTVTRQVPLPAGPSWGSIAVLPDGEILLSAYGDCQFYRADASTFATLPPATPMTLVQEPIAGCTAWAGGEGLVALPDGRVVASVEPHALAVFPPTLPGGPWVRESTLQMRYGLGLFTPDGMAWDSSRSQFLFKDVSSPNDGNRGNQVLALDDKLRQITAVRVLSTSPDLRERNYLGLAYRADTDTVLTGQLGRALADFPPGYPSSWAQTRIPALVSASLADPGAAIARLDLTTMLEIVSGGVPPIYNATGFNNGVLSLAFLDDEQTYAVRLNGDTTNIRVVRDDGTLDRSIGVSVSCTPGFTFRSANVAAVPPSPLGARYLVSGQCTRPASTPPSPEDIEPSQLVFLDADGLEVLRFAVSDLGDVSTPSHVQAITSGKLAGNFVLLDRNSLLVVFRIM